MNRYNNKNHNKRIKWRHLIPELHTHFHVGHSSPHTHTHTHLSVLSGLGAVRGWHTHLQRESLKACCSSAGQPVCLPVTLMAYIAQRAWVGVKRAEQIQRGRSRFERSTRF